VEVAGRGEAEGNGAKITITINLNYSDEYCCMEMRSREVII
jgi:hypothetical protein